MKAFENTYVKRVAYSIQFLSAILFMFMIYTIQLVPMKYVIIVGVVLLMILAGEFFLIFYNKEKKIRSLITQIIAILLSGVLAMGSFYVYKMGRTVDLMTENSFQKRAISIIVLKDSSIKNEKQITDHQLGYVSSINSATMEYAIEDLKKNIGNVDLTDYKDFDQLLNALYEEDIDAMILDEAFRSLVTQDKESFTEDTRVIYQVIKEEDSVASKSVSVTEKPFLVYVSGIDEYGDLSTISRSDVNMLVGVNPRTKQILLISIPRDTYFPLHSYGQYDKFTHTGVYGLQESIDTLHDLIDEDINYYARMNFTSFMNIVDALGGITVYSPQSFTTKIGNYDIKEGENTLNASQALGFVRERKSFIDGDFERGRNQQRMISAIVKKICSPAILTSFSSVLDTISESVETNLSTNEINALVQMQLSDMPSWDIQSYQIIGEVGNMPCYSLGGLTASVVIPSELSLQQARDYIDQLMSNQTIQTEDGDFNQ